MAGDWVEEAAVFDDWLEAKIGTAGIMEAGWGEGDDEMSSGV